MKLTYNQCEDLRKAVYLIADARYLIQSLNEGMIESKNWEGQGDIAELLKNLESLCEKRAGGIGIYLEEM